MTENQIQEIKNAISFQIKREEEIRREERNRCSGIVRGFKVYSTSLEDEENNELIENIARALWSKE